MVGAGEPESATLISVYPNPVSEILMVEMRGFDGTQLEISVRDLNGRNLRSVSRSAAGSDQFTEQISLHGLPAGMYFVRVSDGKAVWMSEVVKE